jgi:hemin uptake protein HemP
VLTLVLRIIIICNMIKPSDKSIVFASESRTGDVASARKRISSKDLFGSLRELVIEHVGEEYRLRITSQGKLILTK